MSMHFSKHYTLEEARALLPQIREWFQNLAAVMARIQTLEKPVSSIIDTGQDAGGNSVNHLVQATAQARRLLQEFIRRDIQVKDLERGLIDFPSIREGREIFLCWEKDEEDIEYWHDLQSGFAGRERL
jgi:hypothetical protein